MASIRNLAFGITADARAEEITTAIIKKGQLQFTINSRQFRDEICYHLISFKPTDEVTRRRDSASAEIVQAQRHLSAFRVFEHTLSWLFGTELTTLSCIVEQVGEADNISDSKAYCEMWFCAEKFQGYDLERDSDFLSSAEHLWQPDWCTVRTLFTP